MSIARTEVALQNRTLRLFQALVIVGGICCVAGMFLSPQRAWANLLLVSFGLVGVGLGGAFFVAMQYLSGAGWATALRRVPEAMIQVLPVGAAGMILVLIFRPALYPWVDPSPELTPLMAGFKGVWLNRPFFLGRAFLYLALWLTLSHLLVRNSRRQDEDGDPAYTAKNTRLSGGFMVIYGVTFCTASFDWIMSLEPEWFSTIFGVYNFAGMFVTTLALIVLMSVWLKRAGPFAGVLSEEHLHDLGKLIFGFSTFWAYIWFSQYMLIWYANFPEETGYFVMRRSGAWDSLFLLNFGLNWAIPFFALLSRNAKRSTSIMVRVAALLLVGRWLDLYLMIMPPATGAAVPQVGLLEIGLFAGAIGIVPLLLLKGMRAAAPLPLKDPLLQQSLHHEQ